MRRAFARQWRILLISCLIVCLPGCTDAGQKAKIETKRPAETIKLMNAQAETMKLKIELLQAQRKQVEYEYSAMCYKDKRWRDYTGQIEAITKQLEQFLMGVSK